MRRLPWTAGNGARNGSELREPPLEARWVVFAGDVPGARWALVVAGDPTRRSGIRRGPPRLLAAWFGGPPQARPDQLTLQAPPAGVPATGPAALLDQRTGTLVVVTAAGDAVEVSERPDVAANGVVYRDFRRVEVADGVAVARLRPSDVPVSEAAVYRVLRGGRTIVHAAPWTVGNRPGGALPVEIEHLRGPPSATGDLTVRRSAERVLGQLGLARHEIEVTALWTGHVPGPGPELGEAALVAVPLPSGAVVVDGEWLLPVASSSGDYLQGGDCGLDVLPAGPPVEERVLAVGCEVLDPQRRAPARTMLVVVGPPATALVRLYDTGDAFLGEYPAVDGVVVAPMARGTATVEAVTSGGVGLGRTTLLGRGVDFGT